MAQVRVVTDSGAYLPDAGMIARYKIEVIPMVVRLGGQSYLERVNQIDDAFLRRMSQADDSVAVEPPSLSQVRAVFGRLGETTDSIVCIHTSSALHDIAEISERASHSFMGRQRIIVLDTMTTSVGLGLIVEAAAKAAAEGASQADVVKIVRGMIPHIYALFLSDSLAYLETWGRLGSAQTMLGTMLGLRPISIMEDGDFIPVEKVRNYARAVDKLYEFIIEFSHIKQMFLVQHGFETEAAHLLERLDIAFPHREFPVIGYSPSLAVHIGPKALGVVVCEGAL